MNMRRLLARPGVFIIVVALVVFAGAAVLWEATRPKLHVGPDLDQARNELREPTELPSYRNSAATDATVARALLDMAHMVYEEPLASPLEDGVKQADFALVQAMLRCDIQLDGAVIEKTELRHDPAGSYNFQRILLAVGDDHLPFVTSLHDSLRAWADGAELARGGRTNGTSLWTISINEIVTHEIVLSVTTPSASQAKEGPRRIFRRRAPGAPARLVIVIDDLGEDMGAVRTLARLPFPVTFAVWPHSTNARKAAEAGHAAGREILVHQPTEPIRYPEMNPGPRALFTSLTDKEIEVRVFDSLKQVPHAVGMNNHMGSRFTRDRRCSAAMVRPLKEHGLFVLDSMTHPGSILHAEAARLDVPALKRDVFLDAVQNKANVLQQLRKAENIALVTGSAIAIGHPLPETLAALREWENQRNTQVEYVTLRALLTSP